MTKPSDGHSSAAPGRACESPTWKHPAGRTGTEAGYAAHRAASEPACDECREAHRVLNGARKRANIESYRRQARDRRAALKRDDPERYELMLEYNREHNRRWRADPENRKKEAARRATPEYRERANAARRTPEARAQANEARRRRRQDPERRARERAQDRARWPAKAARRRAREAQNAREAGQGGAKAAAGHGPVGLESG